MGVGVRRNRLRVVARSVGSTVSDGRLCKDVVFRSRRGSASYVCGRWMVGMRVGMGVGIAKSTESRCWERGLTLSSE